MDALALHIGTGCLPDLERLGVIAKIDADFLENGIGVALHQRQALLVKHLVIGNFTGNVRY
jgi:hypothetical protein